MSYKERNKPLKTRIEIVVVDGSTEVGRVLAKAQGQAVRRALQWFAANPPAKTERLGYGQLTALILAHLRSHPDKDFTPYDLAKVLGRSAGGIRRTLKGLAADGVIIETNSRPARFQYCEDRDGP